MFGIDTAFITGFCAGAAAMFFAKGPTVAGFRFVGAQIMRVVNFFRN